MRIPHLYGVCLVAGWIGWWISAAGAAPAGAAPAGKALLMDGSEFASWEREPAFTRTYYVNNRDPNASDDNPGTEERPFRTINRAAEVLEPGQRVVIAAGVYRERIDPRRGGSGPDRLISYEAAPGAEVIVRGSRLAEAGWTVSGGYRLPPATAPVRPPTTLEDSSSASAARPATRAATRPATRPTIYRLDLGQFEFHGYNPFGMANAMGDRKWLQPTPEELKPHLLRRGMVFCDGKPLEQVELYRDLAGGDGRFWVEHHGLALHARLPGDAAPGDHRVEVVTQEQVLAPRRQGLAFVRVKGLTLEHAANGFPVPQRGLLSISRGHHWIIEDCTLRHANGVGIDFGIQDWHAERPALIGHGFIRRNRISDIGVCGIAGYGVQNSLIESNLIERVGLHDVELMWESGGIKLHHARNCLLRNNVIRHLRWAPGIWLDAGNRNTRITGNVIADIRETIRGGVYIEVSQSGNMIDQNLFWNITGGKGGSANRYGPEGGRGVILDGTDETLVAHNLFGFCSGAGVQTRTNEGRIVGTRGGTARDTRVLYNVFYRCGASVFFSNPGNFADGNAYVVPAPEEVGGGPDGRGLNWMPELKTTLYLDVPAWRKLFGFDRNGGYADLRLALDPDALELQWELSGDLPHEPTSPWFEQDLRGQPAGGTRPAGPLLFGGAAEGRFSIDPR